MKKALDLLRVYNKVSEDDYASIVIYSDGSGHMQAGGHDGVEIKGTDFIDGDSMEGKLIELIARTVDK